MEKTELIIKDDFDKQLPKIITNIDAIKQWATEQVATDLTLVLETQQDFDYAEERCAQLNRLLRHLDDRRKDIKKRYTAPVTAFEKSIKELNGILSRAKDNLWLQVKERDEQGEKERYELYKKYYAKQAKNTVFYRPFEMIVSDKWLKKSAKETAVKKELDDIIEQTNKDLHTIMGLKSQNTTSLLLKYRDGATLAECMMFNHELSDFVLEHMPDDADEEQVEISFRVKCSKSQLHMLKDYLKQHNIEYGRA